MALKFKLCSCGVEIISLPTRFGKWVNVDRVSLSAADQHEIDFGYSVIFNNKRHVPHFVTCENNPNRKSDNDSVKRRKFPHIDKAPVIYE